MSEISYQRGFGNHFCSEAMAGALPEGQNSPQKAPLGLVAEQLSGTAFTARRHENLRSWQYRIAPSVVGNDSTLHDKGLVRTGPIDDGPVPNNPLRWDPEPAPDNRVSFAQGWKTVCVNGSAEMRHGSAVHLYSANESMENDYFYNADGELLIVPCKGEMEFFTEFGRLAVEPGFIVVIPRGVKFKATLKSPLCQGYICENYGNLFQLPGLGPIGANGLANPQDFESPTADFEDKEGNFTIITKFMGELWQAPAPRSPLNVVAWHGNYAPYRYDLRKFNTIGTVSYDHPDPSIFTVLTSQTDREGCANVDFVIFPPRWMVAKDTFRPPYFHRNVMSEYMGLIYGVYDAKPAGGFEPGGGSLHNCMVPHGPEAAAYHQAMEAQLKPEYLDKTLAFMFESSFVYKPTKTMLESPTLQKDYTKCWQGIKKTFQG